jgi:hypothetical protein
MPNKPDCQIFYIIGNDKVGYGHYVAKPNSLFHRRDGFFIHSSEFIPQDTKGIAKPQQKYH